MIYFLRSNLYSFWTLAKIILCNSDDTGFSVQFPVTNAWNCHSLYTAFSNNVGAWGIWACSLFLSFLYCIGFMIWICLQTQQLIECNLYCYIDKPLWAPMVMNNIVYKTDKVERCYSFTYHFLCTSSADGWICVN